MTTVTPDISPPAARTVHIALVGNPNTGKTTVFNRLTGVRQRVGNYPGVTVERKLGSTQIDGRPITVIDLPGTYSLVAESVDERVVIDVLAGRIKGTPRPDVAVCVVDATNLKRNLFLAMQLAETGLPLVIALNMADEADDQGIHIDTAVLSERLGVPVVSMSAAQNRGINELKQAIARAIEQQPRMIPVRMPESVIEATHELRRALGRFSEVELNDAELRRLLFDADSAVLDRFGPQRATAAGIVRETCDRLASSGACLSTTEAIVSYAHLDTILHGVVTRVTPHRQSPTHAIDYWLTHRLFGLVAFFGLMAIVFISIYIGANPLMDAIDAGKGYIQNLAGGLLAGSPMLESLVVDGVIEGVGAVVIFLPQILILFFFISLLEDTGYMARAAFLMDKLFGWCGLNGKCFVPMLSSFACAVPGILSARTISDPKARLTTILVAPLMSCSARLPVYVLLIAALIEPVYGPWLAGLALLAMHFVGLAVALPIAFVVNRFLLKTKSQPFVLEMPPYRTPRLRDVLHRMWHQGAAFLKAAGTIIFAMTIIIWALLYFPHGEHVEQQAAAEFTQQVAAERGISDAAAAELVAEDEDLAGRLGNTIDAAYVEQSMLGRAGKFVQPVFAPAGFDWKITVSVLAAFPAREVVVSTLGIIYRLGGDTDEESTGLRDAVVNAKWSEGARAGQPVFTPLVAFALMVFFALCSQCGSTLAVIARETSWRWAVVSFLYMTTLAWLGAVAVYQVGSLLV